MGNRALEFFPALLLGVVISGAAAREQAPTVVNAPPKAVSADAPNRAVGYTAWDDEFLYVAVQVNKPTLSAKNSEPFSKPLDDDATIISLQTDDDHVSVKRTAHTMTVAVSASGGFQLYSGANAAPLFASLQDFNDQFKQILQTEKDPITQQKKLLELQGKVVKVKVVQKGTDRAGGGSAPGYTLEIAIPWADLGGKPAAGTHMGFNVAVQSKAAGSPPLQGLSPGVKGASDVENPSLWTRITLSNAPAASAAGSLTVPRVFTQKPVIDGDVSTVEWNNLSSFSFGEVVGNVQDTVVLDTVRRSRTPLELSVRRPKQVVPLPASSEAAAPLKPHAAQNLKVP